MKNKNFLFLSVVLILAWTSHPVHAENISFRICYSTNTIQKGDLFSWIDSFNTLWQDWQSSRGGTLDGQFKAAQYGFSYDVEMRIPIVSGLAFNIGGSQLKSRTEGTVNLDQAGRDQSETHSISNKITAVPLKIGLSYSFRLPFFSHLSVCVGGGRLIVLGKYETSERYDLILQQQSSEYDYWYERSNTFKSDALGFYANVALEYELAKFVAVVVEAEQKWAKLSGFKGPYTYEDFEGNQESGKASLYFYESNQWGLGKYYSVLYGHRKRPDDAEIRNTRQGELNFGGYSLKVGIRILF
ncbi:MAG: hypothetical protein PVI11_02750 [Candidatus Aminicenantes bacterium]